MDTANNSDELIDRFIHKRFDDATTVEMVEWLNDLRVAIEKQGRLAELRQMIKYHQRQAEFSTNEQDKMTHLSDIVVLESRISFIEGQRSSPPVTSD